MSRESGRLVVGTVSALAGAGSLAAGLVHTPWLPASVAGIPGFVAACLLGGALLMGGLLAGILSLRDNQAAPDIVPAEVAFASRMVVAHDAAQPSPAGMAVFGRVGLDAVAQGTRPAPGTELPPTPILDEEIRDLTRRISKAGVMLATGQISQQGYASYVEDLKRQRGVLEAKRVDLKMRAGP